MQDLSAFSVLVVDDERDNLDAFRFNYRKSFKVLTAESGDEALGILRDNDVAVLVSDQRMPRMTGLELLKQARQVRPEAIGIILTAYTDIEVLVEAINLGDVYRYVTKPWDAKELRGILIQAIEKFHLRRENRRLSDQLKQYAGYLQSEAHGQYDFGAIIGDASTLRDVLRKIEQVAPTASTVLVRGETGTGKELVARAIHINSPRESKPFVRVNCAALAPGILESELFGHEKGAFTGAIARRAGRFELADGGTLFLDEVGDLPAEVQVKLLRVLQEREFERVGGTETLRCDVRVISATNRDLETMVHKSQFREDLYYRLNVFPIDLPPLRARQSDIPLLAEHFALKFARRAGRPAIQLDGSAIDRLKEYAWPGNVRELENVMERAIIVMRGPTLTGADLDFGRRSAVAPPALDAPRPSEPPPAPSGVPLQKRLHEQERAEIIAAIERSSGNIAMAARALGINRSTLYYRLRKHDLEHLLPSADEPPK